ncbi:hypothetical protein FHG87_009458 [Trinorchestia longiramus]|nr:hypothetical protein FHG87_009458 [Trinorchestia longiramus]
MRRAVCFSTACSVADIIKGSYLLYHPAQTASGILIKRNAAGILSGPATPGGRCGAQQKQRSLLLCVKYCSYRNSNPFLIEAMETNWKYVIIIDDDNDDDDDDDDDDDNSYDDDDDDDDNSNINNDDIHIGSSLVPRKEQLLLKVIMF